MVALLISHYMWYLRYMVLALGVGAWYRVHTVCNTGTHCYDDDVKILRGKGHGAIKSQSAGLPLPLQFRAICYINFQICINEFIRVIYCTISILLELLIFLQQSGKGFLEWIHE